MNYETIENRNTLGIYTSTNLSNEMMEVADSCSAANSTLQVGTIPTISEIWKNTSQSSKLNFIQFIQRNTFLSRLPGISKLGSYVVGFIYSFLLLDFGFLR